MYPAGEEGLGEACGEEVWGVVVGLEWVGEEVSRRARRAGVEARSDETSARRPET